MRLQHCHQLQEESGVVAMLLGPNTAVNIMDYVTIASVGNATDFGDLIAGNYGMCGLSNDTRGIFAGGLTNVIQYITIASTGNSIDFGDLLAVAYTLAGGASSTRGLMVGGNITGDIDQNVIQYVTIASAGNSTDFGDLAAGVSFVSGCSNAHGGL
jgi:Na+-transporting methylmalonyl-CoA/oxaloacetate decarboxylase beta subunit